MARPSIPNLKWKAGREIKEKPLQINTLLIWIRPSPPLSSSPIQVTPQQDRGWNFNISPGYVSRFLQKLFAECATLPGFCPLEATMHHKNTYMCVIKEATNMLLTNNLNELLKQGYTGDVSLRVEPNWLLCMTIYRKYLPLIKQRNCLCAASCIKASFSFSFADWGNPRAGWMPLASDFCSLTLAHTLQM